MHDKFPVWVGPLCRIFRKSLILLFDDQRHGEESVIKNNTTFTWDQFAQIVEQLVLNIFIFDLSHIRCVHDTSFGKRK